MSATIIPFPQTATRVAEASPDRLALALAGLEDALAEQRTAMAEWRASLAALQGAMSGMGQSLEAHQSNLGQLMDDVTAVNRHARQLEAWADGAASTQT